MREFLILDWLDESDVVREIRTDGLVQLTETGAIHAMALAAATGDVVRMCPVCHLVLDRRDCASPEGFVEWRLCERCRGRVVLATRGTKEARMAVW
jgi:hypothetical protein